jgi:aspartyl-tRNA(Asn)/glutamyl-tRNA(Gln) amidotransferase subunit A
MTGDEGCDRPERILRRPRQRNRDLIQRGVDALQKLGCEVKEVSLPATEWAISCYYIICTAEASSNLARYDGVRYTMRSAGSATLSAMYRNTRGDGFGAECKRRIMLGTYVLSHGYYDAYYLKAQRVRTLISRDFQNAFGEVDALITPVSPFRPSAWRKLDDPLEMYHPTYTITGDLAGILHDGSLRQDRGRPARGNADSDQPFSRGRDVSPGRSL